MKTICIYHRSDLDGHCSGAIVKKKYPDAIMIGLEYGDTIPWDKFNNADIILVDFSLQPFVSEMQRLIMVSNHVTWIDHHRTAIEEYKKSGMLREPKLTAHLEEGIAACELAFEFFFPSHRVPQSVTLLGRYDVWDHSDPDTLPFQMGMRLNDTDPKGDYNWDGAFTDGSFIQSIIAAGKVIIKYQDNTNEKIMHNSFVANVFGIRMLVVNDMMGNSLTFKSKFDPDKHDGVMKFFIRGNGKVSVSMYSIDQSRDLSIFAKQMGGGGHPGACGFVTDTKWLDSILS